MAGAQHTAEALLGVVADEVAEFRRLLPLLDAETSALVAADAAAVAGAVRRQADVVARLSALDAERRLLAARTAAALGVPVADVTLSRVAALAPGAAGSIARTEVRALLERAGVVARKNRFLLDRTLSYFDGLLGAVHAATGADPGTYAGTGRAARPAAPRARLDREA